jgi:hypothetical protein
LRKKKVRLIPHKRAGEELSSVVSPQELSSVVSPQELSSVVSPQELSSVVSPSFYASYHKGLLADTFEIERTKGIKDKIIGGS